MTISKKTLSFIILAIALNNLVWLYSVREDKDHPSIESESFSQKTPETEFHKHTVDAQEVNSVFPIDAVKGKNLQPTSKNKPVAENSPEGINTADIDVPQEASQNYQREKAYAAENYSSSDTSKKLETIQELSAQGDDLKLIGNILNTENDNKLRVAALSRLNQAQSYAATNILIKSLDDRDLSVSATALHIIAVNGDKTLVPVLKEKVTSMPNGSIRDMYEESINKLENSGIMAMDANIVSK